jgi:hypothetical protein
MNLETKFWEGTCTLFGLERRHFLGRRKKGAPLKQHSEFKISSWQKESLKIRWIFDNLHSSFVPYLDVELKRAKSSKTSNEYQLHPQFSWMSERSFVRD